MSNIIRLVGSATAVWGAGGQSCGRINSWRDGVLGPTPAVAQLPVATCALELCARLPLLLLVSLRL